MNTFQSIFSNFYKILFMIAPSSQNSEHITDIYITETDTTELENLSHNIIDIFIFEA